MTPQPTRTRRERSAGPTLGVLLVLVGLFFVVIQVLGPDWPRIAKYGPDILTGLGVLLFVLAFFAGAHRGETLVVFGSMMAMAGLLLLYQDRSGNWASWAYAWALVAPTSIGIGFLIYGPIKHRPDLTRRGVRMTAVGLALFLVLLVLFEVVFVAGGWLSGLTNLVPAVILISIGAVILLASWFRRREPRS